METYTLRSIACWEDTKSLIKRGIWIPLRIALPYAYFLNLPFNDEISQNFWELMRSCSLERMFNLLLVYINSVQGA